MITSWEVPLYFLGSRNYVNGLTLFEEMINPHRLGELLGSRSIASIKQFKISRFFRSHGVLSAHLGAEAVAVAHPNPGAMMHVALEDGTPMRLYLDDAPNGPEPDRSPNIDRGVYLQQTARRQDGSRDVSLRAITGLRTLMRGVVEASFQHCVERAAGEGVSTGVSWAYLSNFTCPTDYSHASAQELQFAEKLVQRTPERMFVIYTLQAPYLAGARSTTCFFYPLS